MLVDTFGTSVVDEQKIERSVIENFDLRPAAIIDRLGLRKPIYQRLAAYGHMGREDLIDVSFEQTDAVDFLKRALQ